MGMDWMRGRGPGDGLATSVLPQLVPVSLLTQSRREGRQLAAIRYVGDTAVAFVLDEPDRYRYIHRSLMAHWKARETDLLALAVRNLQERSDQRSALLRIGRGSSLALVWQCFDGYDASRVMLARTLAQASAELEGNLLVAMPHRDYMVMFGDADAHFVEHMSQRVCEEFETHPYPITPRIFTWQGGALAPYDQERPLAKVVN